MPMTEDHRREYDLANRLDEEFQAACREHYGEPAVCCRKPGEPLAEHLQDLSDRRRASIERLNDHCRMQREEPKRRAELDQELKAMGAHVIHVRDLGAALEAQEWGRCAIAGTLNMEAPQPYGHAWSVAFAAASAAHLARQALGESS